MRFKVGDNIEKIEKPEVKASVQIVGKKNYTLLSHQNWIDYPDCKGGFVDKNFQLTDLTK